jgi:hypothetical protein
MHRIKIYSLYLITFILFACASKPQVAVDPKSITDIVRYNKDKDECTAVAQTYDLSEKTGKNAMVGGAAGAVGVAGVATAVAGAVFWPAIPFIVAGGAAGATTGGGFTKMEETKVRENILEQCMTERGYKVYGAK